MIWQALITVLGELAFGLIAVLCFGYLLCLLSPSFKSALLDYLTAADESRPYDYERERVFDD